MASRKFHCILSLSNHVCDNVSHAADHLNCRIGSFKTGPILFFFTCHHPEYELSPHKLCFKCCNNSPHSATFMSDKNQSNTLENSISLMRYDIALGANLK